jgi:signal transduction histidine kinase
VELNRLERWIARVRLIAVPFAAFQVAVSTDYPAGYQTWAWVATGALAAGAVALAAWARPELTGQAAALRSATALAFDFAIVSAYVFVYSWEPGTPTRQLLFFPLIEGCVRFAVWGGIAVAVLSAPVAAAFESLRRHHFGGRYRWDFVTFQVGLEVLMALIVGWLVGRLAVEYVNAQTKAVQAAELHDELGRRIDLVDAVNRCARALSSSLELPEAFGAFIRELRGLLRFERVAIVLPEDGSARVMATAGMGADDVFPPGSLQPLGGSLLEKVMTASQPIYRPALDASQYPEEAEFIELGLGSRLAAPLVAGTRTIGMISVVRAERNAFDPAEIELIALLGRLVATAAQNIHAYDSERRTVEELRKLSILRADFVSLVSHELRSPMAAVIGSARTLQRRWRELSVEHRESFLALIADETDRLAHLVGEVLDTSRIDAGTFSYSFGDVDLGALVEDAVTTAAAGQDEVELVALVPRPLPTVRADGVRLRQVLVNLIDNAVKYSPDGERVEVRASSVDGRVLVDVTDHGAGIALEDQRMIFEKFGRVRSQDSKPGTGLGLYIARSIAEAHGGSLEVSSIPGRGTTFTLTLPSEARQSNAAGGAPLAGR